MARSFAGGSSMEKVLNVRLFTTAPDHPQWPSGYVRSSQPEGTGFKFCFFVLFCLLICFAGFFLCFFVFLLLNIYLNNC